MTKGHWVGRLFAMGGGGGLLFGIFLVLGTPSPTLADPLLGLAFRGSMDACDHLCRECATDKHDIVVAVENKHHADHLENCNPGTCDSHSCGETFFEDLAQVLEAVQQESPEALRTMLIEHPERAVYNPERRSIQVWCEEGTLVANLPLTVELVERLEQ